MTAAASPRILGELAIIALPQVTEAAALDDRSWFGEHPERRFRAGDGGLWAIRRRSQGVDPDVHLRTFSLTVAPPRNDRDGEISVLWYLAAYPDWPPETTQKAARKALRKSKS
jgi:hypothetical protein